MRSAGIIVILFALLFTGNPKSAVTQSSDHEYGRYGKDSITCVMNISLYREFFKQWKASGYESKIVNDAIGPWRWVFLNCPKGTQNTYIEGVKLIEYMMEQQEDEVLKDKYVDTLMMLYDQRIEYFNKEGYVLGRKGVDLYKYRPSAYKEVFDILGRSVELEGMGTDPPVVVYYFRSAIAKVKEGEADTGLIVDTYLQSMEIVEHNLKKGKRKANWEIVQGNVELSFEPYATCEDLIPVYREKFTETPDDIDLLKKITTMLDDKNCQEDPLYFETSAKLYELEPSPESAYLLGKMLLKEGDFEEAISYLEQSEGMEDKDKVAKAKKYIAESYRALKNFPTARKYALEAAAIDPDDGEVYILIGDMYAESAKDCGDNELTNRVAYWAAVDKYYKAKQVDPELETLANKRISSYSVYFPSNETIFFYDLKEGDPYTVECWINERTTVRASK
jgi:tetratricopeptide (TPR) repeat protein